MISGFSAFRVSNAHLVARIIAIAGLVAPSVLAGAACTAASTGGSGQSSGASPTAPGASPSSPGAPGPSLGATAPEHAEYAVRWRAIDGGPQTAPAVLAALGLSADDVDDYQVQYFDIQPPADAPAGFTAILRQRKKGKKKYQLTFKYRGASAFPAAPTLADWSCPLPGAAERKDEVDLSFSATEPGTAAHSRSCTVETDGAPPAIPESLAARPRACSFPMTRHKAGAIKVEEWRLAPGEVVLEVSRNGQNTAAERDAFQREIVDALVRAGARPTERSKTELGGACP